MTKSELDIILEKHAAWLRGEPTGERANLRYANLRSADLRSADLTSANLRSADLRYANLRSADLRSADLTSANLRYANLTSADLRYANLTSADLGPLKTLPDSLRIETGETWKEYRESVVPALLTAGGKSIEDLIAHGAHECHSWENCPMAFAFGVQGIEGVPLLLRPRAEQFVRYYDWKLLNDVFAPRALGGEGETQTNGGGDDQG